MFKKLRNREAGDTIVEVLIAMAILVLVLGGAYYTANESYRNDRDSQEHTEGLTIAQTQVEQLRTYLLEPGNSFNGGCMQSPDTPATSCYFNSNNTSTSYASESDCLNAGAPYCYDVSINEPTSATPVSINQNQAPIPSVPVTTYEVQVTWPALGGGNDNVTLYYRFDGLDS